MTLPTNSCYRQNCEKVRTQDSRQNGEHRQDKFPHLVELKTIGDRLIFAFQEKYGKGDKEFIAEKLGYKGSKMIYKVINGERELGFDKLKKFKASTNRSIDWLLTGEELPTTGGISREAFGTNDRVFIEMLAAHVGVPFDDMVRQLVSVGLDEQARALAGNYKKMSEDELRDMLDAVLANDDPEANDKSTIKKKRR